MPCPLPTLTLFLHTEAKRHRNGTHSDQKWRHRKAPHSDQKKVQKRHHTATKNEDIENAKHNQKVKAQKGTNTATKMKAAPHSNPTATEKFKHRDYNPTAPKNEAQKKRHAPANQSTLLHKFTHTSTTILHMHTQKNSRNDKMHILIMSFSSNCIFFTVFLVNRQLAGHLPKHLPTVCVLVQSGFSKFSLSEACNQEIIPTKSKENIEQKQEKILSDGPRKTNVFAVLAKIQKKNNHTDLSSWPERLESRPAISIPIRLFLTKLRLRALVFNFPKWPNRNSRHTEIWQKIEQKKLCFL